MPHSETLEIYIYICPFFDQYVKMPQIGKGPILLEYCSNEQVGIPAINYGISTGAGWLDVVASRARCIEPTDQGMELPPQAVPGCVSRVLPM